VTYNKSIVAFSAGDPNGIGLEVFSKSMQNSLVFNYCTPVLHCHERLFKEYHDSANLELPDYRVIRSDQTPSQGIINLHSFDADLPTLELGEAQSNAGHYAHQSLVSAINSIKDGKADNLVTLPINKNTIQSEDFKFPGHTEYLAQAFGVEDYMMILMSDEMKMGVATGHIPLSKVSTTITQELIEKKIRTLIACLQEDFSVLKPKIAVLGLNPHSGDGGLLGNEEKDIIIPVIDKFRKEGEIVVGPYPADAFFGNSNHKQFDAVLAMYHDQGLIPFKQVSFSKGTNYTAGLPIIRTSPDHGTAFDIAGKNTGDPSSLLEAIFSLYNIYNTRLEYFELKKDPLKFIKHKREKFSIGVPNLK